MRILIDADGCPVVNQAIRLGNRAGLEVILLCDTSHVFQREGARTITVSKGADSVDFALVNLLEPGDVAVTQDYGLAAMCLARRARVLHQDGHEYTPENIDGLLAFRHEARKLRRAGGRTRGPAKRIPAQDEAFRALLARVLAGEK